MLLFFVNLLLLIEHKQLSLAPLFIIQSTYTDTGITFLSTSLYLSKYTYNSTVGRNTMQWSFISIAVGAALRGHLLLNSLHCFLVCKLCSNIENTIYTNRWDFFFSRASHTIAKAQWFPACFKQIIQVQSQFSFLSPPSLYRWPQVNWTFVCG